MNKKVFDRPMFKKGEEVDVENVGIMSGFKDLFEGEDDDMEEEDDMYDSSEMLDRKPDSPEILMNNLRGDMRSVDARREELADMVGYEAAMETPDAVLALVQSSLAGGIGGLPMGAQPAPQGPMPMPQGPAPMGAQPPMPPAGPGAGALPAPPVNMARGGIVQRFQEGSDEDGVTPAGSDTSSGINYSPELIARAQKEINNFISQRPAAVPTLQQAMADKLPLYKSIMGTGTDDYNQAMALLALGQAGARYATGRDDQGKPITGSGVSRFIQSFSPLGGQFAQLGAQKQKEEQAIKLAALQAGEKEVEAAKAANLKLIEGQRKLFNEVVKAGGKASEIFGKGSWEWNIINKPGLIANWAAGKTTADQDTLIQSAIAKLNTPIVETRTDPVTKEPYTVTRKPEIPPFLAEAIKAREALLPGTARPAAAPSAAATPPAAPAAAPAAPAAAPAAPTTPVASTVTEPAADTTDLGSGIKVAGMVPVSREVGDLPSRGGLWGMSKYATGIPSGILSGFSKIPGFGGSFPDITYARNTARQELENLVEAFIKSKAQGQKEQERLRLVYGIEPTLFNDPAGLRQRLIAIDEELARELELAVNQAYNKELAPDVRAQARTLITLGEKLRKGLGVPVRIYTQEQRDKLAPGTEYLWQGKTPAVRGPNKD